MGEWMTIDDLSEYLQVPATKIRHFIKQRKIPYHDKLGTPRFFKPDIDDWMKTPLDLNQNKTQIDESFIYRETPIKEYMLTASKILIGQTSWMRLPEFIKKAVDLRNKTDRDFLYRKEFEPLMANFNDYLRISCQLGLIDNRREWEREKHYYLTDYSDRLFLEEDTEKIKKIILDSILDIVKRKMESMPQERHAIYLLWYLLKIKEKGIKIEESLLSKGEENNFYPQIKQNFSIGLCEFLFGADTSKELSFLERWEKHA